MRTHFGATVVLALLLTAGCATSPMPRTAFEDIPAVPEGLAYQPDRSAIIESQSVKAVRLVYRGRIEPESLSTAMRTALEANGWRQLSSAAGTRSGATQVYEKGGSSLLIQIREGGLFNWYTYVELTASRATAYPATASTR